MTNLDLAEAFLKARNTLLYQQYLKKIGYADALRLARPGHAYRS